MNALAQMSDEELMAQINGQPGSDISQISDADLMSAIGQTTKQPEKMVGSVFGKVPESAYEAGERNIIGNVFERPGAAIRSAIQGKGYAAGAVNPTNVPTFQDLAIKASQKTTSPVANAALGMIPSALGLAADIATNPADVLGTVIPMTKPGQLIGKSLAATKAGKAISEIATMPIEQIGRPTAEQLAQKVSKTVKEGIEKAVRPSVVGKKTASQQEAYFKKAESAVKDVLDNKANLEIIDKDGGLVVGRNPESLNEALQAVGQTRENIFETYSPMIKKASEDGATVDGNMISAKLKSFSGQENIQLSNPGLAKYADDVASRWENKVIPLEVAEQTAKDFNAMLKQKYQQGKISGADVSSAHVDDMVVRMLRNEIADKAGVGDLKSRYGALAELEADIAKRAIVAGRQNKIGLVDSIANIETGADIAGGVALSALTGNPAFMGFALRGLGAKAAGSIIKNINSPDANIARMFKTVEKLKNTAARSTLSSAEKVSYLQNKPKNVESKLEQILRRKREELNANAIPVRSEDSAYTKKPNAGSARSAGQDSGEAARGMGPGNTGTSQGNLGEPQQVKSAKERILSKINRKVASTQASTQSKEDAKRELRKILQRSKQRRKQP